MIHIRSFSKTLSGGLRVGYIATAAHRVQALCDLKTVTVVSTSDFVERIVHQLISASQYRRHLNRLKTRLDKARRQAHKTLTRLGLNVHPASEGGYHLWIELPQGLDEPTLVRRAAKRSIFLALGAVSYPEQRGRTQALRINVAYAGDERFVAFLRKASAVAFEESITYC